MTMREQVARAIDREITRIQWHDSNPVIVNNYSINHTNAMADAAIAAVLDELIARAEENAQRCEPFIDDVAQWVDTADWLRRQRKDGAA